MPEPKFRRLSVSCHLPVVVGHVNGAHALSRVFEKECEKVVCQTIGRTSERLVSEDVAPTPSLHAQLCLSTIDSGSSLVVA